MRHSGVASSIPPMLIAAQSLTRQAWLNDTVAVRSRYNPERQGLRPFRPGDHSDDGNRFKAFAKTSRGVHPTWHKCRTSTMCDHDRFCRARMMKPQRAIRLRPEKFAKSQLAISKHRLRAGGRMDAKWA